MKRVLYGFLLAVFISSCSPAQPTPKIIIPTIPTIVEPTPQTCVAVSSAPAPGSDGQSIFPPESKSDHTRGAGNPSVTVIYYNDFQDQRSAFLADVLKVMMQLHPDEVRAISRNYPVVKFNDKAALAVQAAEAASEQNKYWEMHDLLYTQQQTWIKLSAQDFEGWLTAQVSGLGMDAKKFQSDLHSADILAKVQKMIDDSQKMGMPGTPVILINKQLYSGPYDYASFNDIIQLIALGKKQFTSCPPFSIDPKKQYTATLHTEKGDVVIQLLADKAPLAVNSFVFLARKGWYDNNTFYYVLPDYLAQTGDPSGTGKGSPGYYFKTEIDPSLEFDQPGVVGMANSGPDTNGSQFFITFAPAPNLDGTYTIFGQVLQGMDVLKGLTPRNQAEAAQKWIILKPGDKLMSVEIQEK